MTGRGKRPLADTEPLIEDILAGRRPHHCADRGDSIYMREEREFSTVGVTFDNGYVHTVEPIGKVDKRDLAWIGVLQRRHHKNERVRKNVHPALSDDDVADRYWNGEASDRPLWEWVTEKATVIDVDDELSRVRPESPLLDAFSKPPKK